MHGQACLSLLQQHSSNFEDGGWCLKELHSLRTGKQWTLTCAKQASVRGVMVTPMLVFRGEVIRLPSTRSQCSSVGAHMFVCVCVNALTLRLSVLSLQALSQHRGVHTLRSADCKRDKDRGGTQGQFLSGGHVLPGW